MKNKKMYLALMLCLATSLTACEKNDTPITFDDLPVISQEFINRHFGDLDIALILKDYDDLSFTYDVNFTNLYEVDFDKNGEWIKVDCQRDSVPEAIVPASIATYVNTRFTGQYIVEIERKTRTYDVELNTGVDVIFDKDGNFKRIDD
ncbi:MAG: PepSY-like domain-containing protein [Paludibacteraceae bacterium]